MLQKLSLRVSLALIVLLVLAACGGGAVAPPTSQPAANQPTSAPATAAPTAAGATAAPTAAVATAAPSGGASEGETAGTYRAALPTGCLQGPLYTTCGHRLDGTILQPLAAITWTADGLQPLLAEEWAAQEDGKIWEIKLREGVTWHDGEPFTADDVVFSFNLYANPAVASTWATKVKDIAGYDEFQAGTASSLAGVTKMDDSTVQIELKSAQPLWMQLQQIFVIMMPEHLLGDVAPDALKTSDFWTNRVGTGPFIWSEYQADQYIIAERNPDYYGGAPKLDRIVYQIYADIASALNALEQGEVDEMYYEGGGIPLTEVERMQQVPDLVVLDKLNAGLPTWVQWDLQKAPFNDLRFRQAVLHAIDREAILDSILLGLFSLSNTQFPQEWAISPDLEPYPYDPERARQLLSEMGFTGEDEYDFIYYYTDNVTKDVVTAMQQYLAEVGIKISPRLLDSAGINAVYADNAFEMGYFANGQGLDPSLGATVPTCGAQLALGYCNERVDELFQLGVSTADPAQRATYYQEISRILNADLQKGYLWYASRPMAFNSRVKGLAEHWQEQPVMIFNTPVYQAIETWTVE